MSNNFSFDVKYSHCSISIAFSVVIIGMVIAININAFFKVAEK